MIRNLEIIGEACNNVLTTPCPGVRSSEATAGRAAYASKATTNTELGARVIYGLDAQQSVFMDLHVTALGSAIKNSPLVDRSSVAGVRLGYAYRF